MRAALSLGHGRLFLCVLVHIALAIITVPFGSAFEFSISTHLAGRTPEILMPAMQLNKRKIGSEDAANPVAAAALDPNEAAMSIKSRDLVPTDRVSNIAVHPQLHHGAHAHLDGDEEMGSDEVNIKVGASSGPKGSGAKKKSAARDGDDGSGDGDEMGATKSRSRSKGRSKGRDVDDDAADDDADKSDKSGSKSKGKKGGSKSKGKSSSDADGDDDDTKDSGDTKDSKDSKDSKDTKSSSKGKGKGKGKNTHTGLDGKEIEDEDGDTMQHKKVQVEHVKAKKKNWRTGRATYDYQKALDGWKSAGPMYYYRGKYLNVAPASRIAASTWAIVLVSAGWMLL